MIKRSDEFGYLFQRAYNALIFSFTVNSSDFEEILKFDINFEMVTAEKMFRVNSGSSITYEGNYNLNTILVIAVPNSLLLAC